MSARLLRPDAGRGFILDGYPTTPEQAESLRRFLAENKYPRPIVILLDASDDILKTRMEMRHRSDDTQETIERRIREYRELGRLAAEWYGSENLLRVDASAPVATVTARVVEQIEEADTTTGFKVRQPTSATKP
jgi:adenylate kinase